MPTKENSAYGARTKERAAFWCVSQRTMQKMLAGRPPWPVDDIAAMLRRVAELPAASRAKLTANFRRRVDELRVERERQGHALVDPDYAEFLRNHSSAAPNATGIIESLKLRRGYADYKLGLAQSRGDLAGIKDATDALKLISSVLYDEETLAQKLNRESGDAIPRADEERFARAVMFWLLRGVDDLIAQIAPRLAAASSTGPLFQEEVRALLEPALVAHRVLAPFERATRISAGVALPAWWLDSKRAAAAAFIADGAAEFDRLHALPLPPRSIAAPDSSHRAPDAPVPGKIALGSGGYQATAHDNSA